MTAETTERRLFFVWTDAWTAQSSVQGALRSFDFAGDPKQALHGLPTSKDVEAGAAWLLDMRRSLVRASGDSCKPLSRGTKVRSRPVLNACIPLLH